MRKVIIDCDPGMDDASALFLAVKGHKAGILNLLAVTTVDGNTSLKNVVRNTARILTVVGMSDQIPIYKGSHSAYVEHVANDPWHGSDGFGDSIHSEEPDLKNLQTEHAVQALVRLARENPGEITLLALGPLTNVAMAMRLDEQFSSNLKELYIMGGNVNGIGNITVSAEFNFHSDSESAFVVLENTKVPTYVASWELCSFGARIDWDWRVNVYGKAESPQSRLMNKIEEKHMAEKFYDFYLVCDQVVIAAFIDPRIITKKSLHYATVELQGRFTRGQMVVDYKGKIPNKQPNVYLIDSIDLQLLKNMMLWSVDHPESNYIPNPAE